MRTLGLTLVFAMLSILPSVARADAGAAVDPDALQAARELSAILTKEAVGEMSTQMSALIWPDMESKLKEKHALTNEQCASLRRDFERIQLEYLTKFMDDVPMIYARHFTASEIRELIAFYRTPIGQKALHTLPQISAESMAAMLPRLPSMQREIMESFGRMLRQRGLAL